METKPLPTIPTYETRKEFAARHKVSARTVDGWIAEGIIPVRRFTKRCVRIPIEKAEEALQAFDVDAIGGRYVR